MPAMEREPRAALILNRFTRTLTVMFATNAVSSILGVRPEQIKDKSFYECIQENCLADAIKCLESAKANDSIAYLRFWYRDPRREEDFGEEADHELGSGSSDSEAGGVQLNPRIDFDTMPGSASGLPNRDGHGSSSSATIEQPRPGSRGVLRGRPIPSFELEAVVSCTSDGLVVVLRRARPPIPAPHPPLLPFDFENGLFAAPWGQQPIRPYYPPDMLYTFRPPLLPQFMPLRENVKAAGGPPLDQLMRSIRDVAVFAWALIGINGNLAAYSHGLPLGESQPPDGLPIWDPLAENTTYRGPENQASRKWAMQDMGKGKAQAEDTQSYHSELSHGAHDYTPRSQLQGYDHYMYTHPAPWATSEPSALNPQAYPAPTPDDMTQQYQPQFPAASYAGSSHGVPVTKRGSDDAAKDPGYPWS